MEFINTIFEFRMRQWMTPEQLKRLEEHKLPFFRTPKEIDALPSPRVIRPHLPLDLLNPNLLDSTKVCHISCHYFMNFFDPFLCVTGHLRGPQSKGRHRLFLSFSQNDEEPILYGNV